MHKTIRTLCTLTCLCLSIFRASSLPARMVTNYPVEVPGAFKNPLKGFRNELGSYRQYTYPTVVRHYIRWNQIENHESDTVQKIRDFCNAHWADLPTNNVRVIPRVYLDWDSSSGNEYWPADLTPGDWSSQKFKDRVVRLIGRLGEVWDNDPRVAWVQTGIIGYWGEQENPVSVTQDGWAQRMGDAFTNAFKNKMLLVRNLNHWPGYEMGVYWDSFGHPGQARGSWDIIRRFNNQGRYLTRVIEGEVAYNWGEAVFDPVYGGEPTITLGNTNYTDNMIDVIRELHCSALGWIASYKTNGEYCTDPNVVRANAARMQDAFGYKFTITEFVCSARTEPGDNLEVRFKVKNTGSAPFYENWPLAVVLVNERTRRMVWKATIPKVDIRNWQPGHNYNYTNRTYMTPAQEHQIAASVPIPASLPVGEYLVGLSILEPMSRTPGIFFAVTNFFKESQTQPLARIGIGTNASSHTLTGVVFDNLLTDDRRYYTTNRLGTNYTLTLLPSAFGVITATPGGTNYVEDTGVEVTAVGNLGYRFSSWGGALAGKTNNPAIVVMDANKSISANFVPVPTYTLTIRATNGSITLNPPGGIYNAGTMVTVRANPNRGYAFGNWSGDLSGSTNPATILMNGNKSVTANFVVFNGDVAPWWETFTLPNGAKSNGPPTTWTATRAAGKFEVSGNRLMVNGAGGEGVLETAPINIAGGSVKASVEVQGQGRLDGSGVNLDYVRFSKIVDGGSEVLVGEILGAVSGTQTLLGTNITGTMLKLRIRALVTAADEYYFLDNLKVEDEVPPLTFTLTTSATNGSITLNPPGGVYTNGTVVTVTATPNSGYTFANWSGDLSGSTNPTTILMDGNKSVTANFALITYTLRTSATNGSITLNPPGGVYTNGTVVTVRAIPNSGYTFANWSGDLSGSANPTTILMDGNKSVTANFIALPVAGTALFVLSGTATNASDTFLANRLMTNFGLNVQFCGGPSMPSDTTLTNATGKALIMISSTISSGDLVAWARRFMTNNLTVPVITWESGNADEWGFCASDGAANATQTLLITNAPNGLTAGLTNGIHTVYTANGNDGQQFSGPNPGVFVAAVNPTTGSIRIAGMPVGVVITNYSGLGVTVTNASRKVFLGMLGNNQAENLNTNGLALFDAAVSWALGQTGPRWIQPPVLQGEQLRLEWAGGTLQSATNVLGPWEDVSGAFSPYLAPTTKPAQFFRVKQ